MAKRRGGGWALALGSAILVGAASIAWRSPAAGPTAAVCEAVLGGDWTVQERWVWNRLCDGQEADLGHEYPLAGDPPAWPAERSLRSIFLTTILQAQPFVAMLPPGGIRIVGARFPDRVDLSGMRLKDDLRLELVGARFLSDLVFSKAKFDAELKLTQATVFGRLDLSNVQIGGDLDLQGIVAARDLDLEGADVGQLAMQDAWVLGLRLKGFSSRRNVSLKHASMLGAVDLSLARIGGLLDMTGSFVVGPLTMKGLDLTNDLYIGAGSRFHRIELIGGRVGGVVMMQKGPYDTPGASIDGDLDVSGLRVTGDMYMQDTSIAGRINLSRARIDGQLSLSRAVAKGGADMSTAVIQGPVRLTGVTMSGPLVMSGLDLQRDLYMGEGSRFGEVSLFQAKIGGAVMMQRGPPPTRGARIDGKLWMTGIEVSGGLYMQDTATSDMVNVAGATIKGEFKLNRAIIDGRLVLDSARIGGDLDLSSIKRLGQRVSLLYLTTGRDLTISGEYLPTFDLSAAHIGGTLHVESPSPIRPPWTDRDTTPLFIPVWWPDSLLVLRNTEVQNLDDNEINCPTGRNYCAWPNRLMLDGFTYHQLVSLSPNPGSASERAGRSATDLDRDMAARKAQWWINWLARQEKYSPEPYESLAGFLRNLGYDSKAKEILFERKKREMSDMWHVNRFVWVWLGAQRVFIGFGHRIWYALVWSGILVATGMFVLHFSGEWRNLTTAADEKLKKRLPVGLFYSLDMLLPFVHLRDWHYRIDLKGWARYYFYGHRIMGYILGSFLLAGLSGLTR